MRVYNIEASFQGVLNGFYETFSGAHGYFKRAGESWNLLEEYLPDLLLCILFAAYRAYQLSLSSVGFVEAVVAQYVPTTIQRNNLGFGRHRISFDRVICFHANRTCTTAATR